jgi:hypothetical protein
MPLPEQPVLLSFWVVAFQERNSEHPPQCLGITATTWIENVFSLLGKVNELLIILSVVEGSAQRPSVVEVAF